MHQMADIDKREDYLGVPLMSHSAKISVSLVLKTALLLAATTAALSACVGSSHPGAITDSTVRSAYRGTQGHTSVADGVVEFRTRGLLNVELDSLGGNVEVVGDAEATVTTVQVVREARHGYLRSGEASQAIDLLYWTAALSPGPGPVETLTIKTIYEGPEHWFMRAHIRIVTPLLDRVRINTTRGSVEVRDNQGAVDVQTSEGNIIVATSFPQRGESRIINHEGEVDYRIPAGSTGAFNVAVTDGTIQARVTEGLWRYREKSNGTDIIHATLNGGTNPVIIRAHEGDVRISVVKNPLGYGPIRLSA